MDQNETAGASEPSSPRRESDLKLEATPPVDEPMAAPAVPPVPRRSLLGRLRLGLRESAPRWQVFLMGLLGIGACFGLWWFVTRGEPEERILSPSSGLSSPSETFATFHSLWFDRGLTRNLLTSLRRVASGFGLATLVGVPLGILCGCFTRVDAFFMPITLFGRNIPVAALIPLTFSLFGIGELQKTMFIFIACVAFIVSDTARAIREVRESYVDSAYTLGAGRWQTIMKVLVPLALPSVFNSLRLLFSLAFGYIMLAEVVKFGGESGGLGDIINTSQRRGPREHVVLVLLIIPVVALAIDRALLWIQSELFPYRYGGAGLLHSLVRAVMHGCEDLKGFLWRRPLPPAVAAELAGPPRPSASGPADGEGP
ncbi:ABC transporter permease [Aquisphaera insulae]|uniref:ABC transporter permease n=1 Tax=Aquisphaera insulae TaxID=2712864 RepID=UPI0013EA3EC1|nr:ABC transporter permease [Aquisphaera insulae]